MQVNLLGIEAKRGVRSDDSEWGPMTILWTLEPIQDRVSKRFSSMGYGFKPVEYEVADGIISEFKQITRFPCVIDLNISTRSKFVEGQRVQVAVVVGFSLPTSKAA